MFSKLKNIANKARNVVKIGLVVMAIVKAITVFADEIDKLETPKSADDE